MGKVHNMIEALPRAKNGEVLFSDADTRISAPLLADAARAFVQGADAVYAMPYHAAAPGLGGMWYMIAFNHAFCVPGGEWCEHVNGSDKKPAILFVASDEPALKAFGFYKKFGRTESGETVRIV